MLITHHSSPITPPGSVLIIVTRRIGDVLLATPLMRSVKRAWPDTALDVLVFEGTQGAISANPDIRRVLTVPERPNWLAHLAFLLRIARRYDIALSTLQGDRPTLYAFTAGRWRAGLLNATREEGWKLPLLHRWAPFDNWNTHTVLMNLALAGCRGRATEADAALAGRAMDIFSRSDPGSWMVAQARVFRGTCLTRLGHFAEAERELRGGLQVLERILGPKSGRVDTAKVRLAELERARGNVR